MALLKGDSSDDLTLKYLLQNGGGGGSQAEIDALKAIIGDTPLTTAADNLTDAVNELDTDMDGKVSKTGDTMTGALTQASSNDYGIYLKNSVMDISDSAPAAASYKYIDFKDKNDNDVAVIYSRQNTAGNFALRVAAHVNSIYNGVTFTINPTSSARSISFDEVAVWLAALGLGSSGALPITLAQGGSGQTAVTKVTTVSTLMTAASGVTINSASFAKWGKLAMIFISFKKSSAISSTETTIATLKSGYRPAIDAPLELRAVSAHRGYIDTDGTVNVAFSSSAQLAANTTCYVQATYLLA